MVDVKFDEARFEETWRTSTYLIYNCMLSLQLASQRIHKTDPSEYLIFSVVACGNLQREMRQRPLREGVLDPVADNDANVPMSRRRIAEATGLPRETVRRAVQKLMDRGLLMESSDGYILVPVGLIRSAEYDWSPEVVMGPVMSLFQSLAGLGVLSLAERSSHDLASAPRAAQPAGGA